MRHPQHQPGVLSHSFILPQIVKIHDVFCHPTRGTRNLFPCLSLDSRCNLLILILLFCGNKLLECFLLNQGHDFAFSRTMSQITRGGHIMKVILRIYEHVETLEREFSSAEEVRRMTRELAEANPNLLIEPCLEVEAGRVIALSEV